jgi:hypothetical protein
MPSRREDILAALMAALVAGLSAAVRRNEPLPEKLPAGGLVMLRDGELGEPEILLSPLTYIWRHRAIIEAVVSGGTAASRDGVLDGLLTAVGDAIAGTPTLGGLADWIEIGPASFETLAIEGAAPLKGATIPIILHYATSSPLS